MLKIKFEKLSVYIDRKYLVNNKVKYEEVVRNLYNVRKITKSNLSFLLDYNKKHERVYDRLPDVAISDENGISVYQNSQGKLKVIKYEYSHISLDLDD